MSEQGKNTAKQGEPPDAYKWKPGQSGNPGGRPKTRPIAAEIKKLLAKNDGKSLRRLARVCLAKGLKGDYRFARELLDRIDGKVVEPHDVTTAGQPLPGLSDAQRAKVLEALGEIGKDAGVE